MKIASLFSALILLFSPAVFAAGKVQEIKTPAGFTVWLVEEHSLPIITTNITFKQSGIAYDLKGKEGRTNLTAALLMEGAGDKNALAFTQALEDNAVRMNFSTDDDVFRVGLELLTEHKEAGFALLADALMRPRFDDDALVRVKAQTLALIKEQTEMPAYKLGRAWQTAAYGDHPYGRPALGNPESIAAITRADLQFFMQHYLTKTNVIISMVGDVTAEDAARLVDGALSSLPETYAPDVVLGESIFPPNAGIISVAHTMPQTMVMFGMPAMKRTDADFIPAFVMNHLLGGGGLTSILAKEIREKRGLAYSVNSQLDAKAFAASWRGMFATRNDQVDLAIETLKETLAQFAQKGVSEKELSDAKSYLTGSFVLNLDSNEGVANFLTTMQLYGLGADYLENRNALVEAVSMDDIKRVTKRIINPSELRIVRVGSAKE